VDVSGAAGTGIGKAPRHYGRFSFFGKSRAETGGRLQPLWCGQPAARPESLKVVRVEKGYPQKSVFPGGQSETAVKVAQSMQSPESGDSSKYSLDSEYAKV
jgi:hypothetical protein